MGSGGGGRAGVPGDTLTGPPPTHTHTHSSGPRAVTTATPPANEPTHRTPNNTELGLFKPRAAHERHILVSEIGKGAPKEALGSCPPPPPTHKICGPEAS